MVRISFLPVSKFPVLLLLSLAVAGCAFGHRYEPISGRVIDADTKEPLEGAVVVAVYNVAMISVGGTSRQYEDAQEGKTDARGEFTLPEKSFSRVLIFGHYEEEPELYAAKPGYGEYVSRGRERSNIHQRAVASGRSPALEIILPRLTTLEERRKYIDWRPFVPSRAERYAVDPAKVPYFLQLENDERQAVGPIPYRPMERKP